MEETLRDILSIVTPLFAIATMLSMGLSLRVRQVLKPLRNIRLVTVALLTNFVIVPAAALLLAEALALKEDIRIGLLLISVAAGAPLTPKLAEIARGSIATAVSLVALMVVVTIVYMPLFLPLVLPDAEVDVLGIATMLLMQLLLPLALGLAVKAWFDALAVRLQPAVAMAGNVFLLSLLVLTFGLNLGDVLDLFGSGGIISILLLILVAAVTGYLLGGRRTDRRRVLALASGQRNLAAAFVVGFGSFADRHEVLAMLASAGLLGMVTIIPLAVVFGRMSARKEAQDLLAREEAGAITDIEDALRQAQRPGSTRGGKRRAGYRKS